jgi:UDP-glucose 4-epimerase
MQQNTPTRWILTGGVGFLGTNLVHALRPEDGEIVVIDRSIPHGSLRLPTVQYVEQDVREVESYREWIIPGSVVVHMAASPYPGKAERIIESDIQDNILGTIRLANACVDQCASTLIFFSSGGALYGEQHIQPIREDANPLPISTYGVMKLATEHYLRMGHMLQTLPVAMLRIGNPYGCWHRGQGQGFVNIMFERLRRGKPIIVWGDGSQTRDFIFADDAVRAVRAIGLGFREGCEAFNIGTGIGRSINEMIDLAGAISGIQPIVQRLPKRIVDVTANALDCGKIKSQFDWAPIIDIRDAMRTTWEWVLANREDAR